MKKIIIITLLLSALIGLIANAQIPQNGLVAYYPFNGNANDESGNGLNGMVEGATLTIDRFGNQNSAYSFTTNQDIIVPNTESLNVYPLSISLWYNVDSLKTGDNGNIFSKYVPATWNGFQIVYADNRNVPNNGEIIDNGFGVSPWYLKNGNDRLIGYYNEPPFLQQNISSNIWYHFVFVVDDTGGKLYVNGQLMDTHIWTGNPGPSTNWYLWKIGGLYDKWFHGKIDEIGIWNRALTDKEIKGLYSNCHLFSNDISNQHVAVGSNAIFTATSNSNTATYQWQTNPLNTDWINVPANTNYSGTTTSSLSVNNVQLGNHNQPFRVIATDGTCVDTSNVAYIKVIDTCVVAVTDTLIINKTISGLSFPNSINIKLYPNPAHNILNIDFDNYSLINGYTVSLTNTLGQQVYAGLVNKKLFSINLADIGGSGVYVVQIKDKTSNLFISKTLIVR